MLNTIHYVDSYTSLICLIVPCFVVLQKLHGKVARFRPLCNYCLRCARALHTIGDTR
jgi:hypothetical protein